MLTAMYELQESLNEDDTLSNHQKKWSSESKNRCSKWKNIYLATFRHV